MTNIALLVAAAFVLLLVIRRIGFLSPTGVTCTIAVLNMVTFYVIELIKLDASSALILSHSYKFKTSYLPQATSTLLIYFVFLLVISTTAWRVKHQTGRNRALRYLTSIGSERFVLSGALVLFMICVLHALITELRFLAPYSVYLQVRDPAYYGVSSQVFALIIVNIGFAGVLSAAFLAMAIQTERGLLVALLFLVFLYTGLFQAAAHSRWLVLQIGILIILVARQRTLLSAVVVVMMLSIIPYAYYSAIAARSNNVFGLEALLQFSFKDVSQVLIVNTFANIAGGGLVLSEAMNRLGTSYPTIYKVLSYSPLPSAFDGFGPIRQAYQVRINIFGPFSSIAEAYWFGPTWMTLFLAIVAQALKRAELMWQMSKVSPKASKQIIAYVAFGLMIYGHVLIHQYPIRNSIRWILLTWMLYPFFRYKIILFSSSRSHSRPISRLDYDTQNPRSPHSTPQGAG